MEPPPVNPLTQPGTLTFTWCLIGAVGLFAAYIILQLGITALNRVRSSKLEELYGEAVEEKISAFLGDAEALLASLRFVSGAVLIGSGAILSTVFISLPRPSWLSGEPLALVMVISALALGGLAVLFIVHLARSFAATRAERICYFGLPIFQLMQVACRPLVILLSYADPVVSKILGSVPFRERDLVYSLEELSELAQRSVDAGEIRSEEHRLLEGVFSFSETTVSEIMTPRNDVICITLTTPLDEILHLLESEGFSRLLVVGEDLDDVRGMLLSKDLLRHLANSEQSFHLEELIRAVPFVSADSLVRRAFKKLRREGAHFAVVTDEHGGTDGIVTMEDILEEIVGDIFDETDTPDEEKQHERTKEGELLVDGGLSVVELNEIYDLAIPEGEYETVAGFVIHKLGRIPEVSDSVRYNGHRIVVEEADNHRVTLLRISNHKKGSNRVSTGKQATVSEEPADSSQAEPSAVRKAS